jgi:hypothetical protein
MRGQGLLDREALSTSHNKPDKSACSFECQSTPEVEQKMVTIQTEIDRLCYVEGDVRPREKVSRARHFT